MTIRRPTAPVSATTFTSATLPTRTSARSRRSTAGAASGAYNAGTGRPHSVRQVIDVVSRVVGAPVRWTSAPRRPGDPAVLYAASHRLQSELGWRPKHLDLEAIVRDAWRWHQAHPLGYLYSAIDLMDPLLRLLRYAAPHRILITGATLAMLVYGAGSAAQAWLIKPIIDDVLILTNSSSLQFVVVAIVVVYFFKGLGGYFSSYLMDDLGHRVVMRIRNDLFKHLLDQSAAFFARRTTGQLLSRINNDVGQVHRAVAETLGDLARESLAIVGFAALLVY